MTTPSKDEALRMAREALTKCVATLDSVPWPDTYQPAILEAMIEGSIARDAISAALGEDKQ